MRRNITKKYMTNENNNKYKRNNNEVGAVFVKENDNNVEYLAIKLNLDGEDIYLKAFLNSGYDPSDEQKKNRPKYLLFKSHNGNQPVRNRNERLD